MALIKKECGRCGGKGGWEGWPGFTCYDCHGVGHFIVDETDEERRRKNRERAALKRRQAIFEQQQANSAAVDLVDSELARFYANHPEVQAKLATLDERYHDSYRIDYFRGQVSRQLGIQLPWGIPLWAPHLRAYMSQLT